MKNDLTTKEAAWVGAVLEHFTTTQERKEDERIRVSVMRKLSRIAAGKTCEEHNHVTRDIKNPGVCPACDAYHKRDV